MPTVSGIIVSTGLEASGRRTLRDILDEMARTINAADEAVRALAGDAFRAAVRVMNRKGSWPWEIQSEELTITGGQRYSTVTSAVKKPLSMHLLSASGGIPRQKIDYIEYGRFMEKYDQNITAEPYRYSIPNLFETGQVQWFPIPSGNDYALFSFYRVTPAPRDEDETVEIPDYAVECYQSRAWYEFIKRLSAGRRPYPLEIAAAEWTEAFRSMSAHVASPGDRSREVWR